MKLPRIAATGALCAGLALAALLSPASARAESLADALVGAYKDSGLLGQNQATLRAADEDVAGAVAALRPVISYLASASYDFSLSEGTDELSSNLSISLEQLLFDFGATRLSIEAAKETVLATREALIGVEIDVLLAAVDAFLDVRNQSAQVNLRQNNVRLIERELRAARDRFEVGEVTRTDVAQAESRLAAARAGLISTQGELSNAREAYLRSVGRYPGTLSPPPSAPATANSLEDARAVARRTHPDIRSAMRQVTVAELNIARAEAAMKPSLSATGSVGVNEDFDNASSLGLRLRGPIYQGGALSAAMRQAQARRDASRASLHNITRLIDQSVGNSWSLLQVARANITSSDEQVRAATVAFEGVQEEATLGARTTLDVLNAEQELLNARAALLTAQTNQTFATYSLLASMGLLTVEHLGLGIVTYDPAAYYDAVRDAPTRFVSPQGEKLDRVLRSLGRD